MGAKRKPPRPNGEHYLNTPLDGTDIGTFIAATIQMPVDILKK